MTDHRAFGPKSLHLSPGAAAFVVIDVQDRLAAAMDPGDLERTTKNIAIAVRGAATLHVPVIVTEQYPRGLGSTVVSLRSSLESARVASPLEKVEFDCTRAAGFVDRLPSGTRDVIISGMEAHICVLQTARGLLESGYRVWVAQDAICSRDDANRIAALRLMENVGAVVAPTETLLFLMLGKAGSAEFKAISHSIR